MNLKNLLSKARKLDATPEQAAFIVASIKTGALDPIYYVGLTEDEVIVEMLEKIRDAERLFISHLRSVAGLEALFFILTRSKQDNKIIALINAYHEQLEKGDTYEH